MLRRDREMGYEETAAALATGKWGVLSTFDGKSSYGVPVNYFYSHSEKAVFFHCAPRGMKLDNIRYNRNVSLTVVLHESIVPGKFTTLYKSVIASGKAHIIEDEEEKKKRLKLLCQALDPGSAEKSDECIMKHLSSVAVVRVNIESISGKQNSE
ncbi:MAG: pyridoxamine 5'-phosphate oxidase family protein [Burkholderiales bacterium]